MDIGKPVQPVKPEPTRVVEALWQKYHEREIGQRVTDGEMIKELRKAFFTGVWSHATFIMKTSALPDRIAVNLLNGIRAETQEVIDTLRGGPLADGNIIRRGGE